MFIKTENKIRVSNEFKKGVGYARFNTIKKCF